jgi:twitching motility two-component system response regulator PilH
MEKENVMAVLKVLCVDDSNADLINLEKIVTSAGLVALTASSGKSALVKAKEEKPDLIFMDINMPDMDGFAVMRELKKDSDIKGIPVVLISSKNQKADKMWAQMQGANGYITKPYTSDQILEQIRSF